MGLLKTGCARVEITETYSAEKTIYYCLKESIDVSIENKLGFISIAEEITVFFPKKLSEYLKTIFIYSVISEIDIITREYHLTLHEVEEIWICNNDDAIRIRPRNSYVTFLK